MKPKKNKLADWQLSRERFHFPSPFPPRPKRPEKTIGAILSEIQGEKTDSFALPNRLGNRWAIIAGEQIARHTYPAFLKGTQLIVYADHPGWLAEIRRVPARNLLKKIMTIRGIPEIKEIRFQLDPAIRTYRN